MKAGISTSAQVVTLTGTVVSEEQKAKILKIVGDMVGEKAVPSEFTVEKG
jgi:osmotically-inducible protein OsmY